MAKILVVDDDDLTQIALRAALQMDEHEVEVASNGDEGLEIYQQQPFDLVVVDVIMPGKSGLDLIRELRQKSPELKIIAISAHPDLEKAVGRGADQTVRKPIQALEFMQIVNRMLGRAA